MYLLYSLVLTLLFVLLLPYYVYQAVRRGKYSGSFKERMGFLPEHLRADARKTIWVHAVSVGEFLAAKTVISRLRNDFPEARIVVSTITLTGQQLARSQLHLFDAALYFPFDWKFSVRRALDIIKPSVVVILETELWPNFLRECKKRGVVTILANGRISARSFRRYQLVGRPFRRALENLSLMVMQSEDDAERIRRLGAHADLVRVCGNLKYDTPGAGAPPPKESVETSSPVLHSEIDQFGASLSHQLIVAGSTAPGEEEILLRAFREIRKQPGLEEVRLLLAPRHPERFGEVAGLISRFGFELVRRSEFRRASSESALKRKIDGNSPVNKRRSLEAHGASAAEVVLLDSIGELASIYRFAAVVFVGGSLVPRGGHNIIEPAAFAKPILVGPHTENFRQIVSDFVRANAVVQISGSDDLGGGLTRELIHLLSDREHARALGERASEILLKNRGATECTMGRIKEVVGSP